MYNNLFTAPATVCKYNEVWIIISFQNSLFSFTDGIHIPVDVRKVLSDIMQFTSSTRNFQNSELLFLP
jgi:hypothetical protein